MKSTISESASNAKALAGWHRVFPPGAIVVY